MITMSHANCMAGRSWNGLSYSFSSVSTLAHFDDSPRVWKYVYPAYPTSPMNMMTAGMIIEERIGG